MGEKIKSYKDLEVYQKAYQIAIEVYKATQDFPASERYEITSQIRRAAISIPANIAEGYGRKKSAEEFKHYLRISLGSTNELQVLMEIAKELGYEIPEELMERIDVLGKQIYRLIEKWV